MSCSFTKIIPSVKLINFFKKLECIDYSEEEITTKLMNLTLIVTKLIQTKKQKKTKNKWERKNWRKRKECRRKETNKRRRKF